MASYLLTISLRDAVSFFDIVRRFAQIDHDHFKLAAIAGVDGSGRIGESDGMF